VTETEFGLDLKFRIRSPSLNFLPKDTTTRSTNEKALTELTSSQRLD